MTTHRTFTDRTPIIANQHDFRTARKALLGVLMALVGFVRLLSFMGFFDPAEPTIPPDLLHNAPSISPLSPSTEIDPVLAWIDEQMARP